MARYGKEIGACTLRDPVTFINYKLDSRDDRQLSITQGVVQDIYHVAVDAMAMRDTPVECIFLKHSDDETENAGVLTALVFAPFTVRITAFSSVENSS